MLLMISLGIMGAVAYASTREGLLTAICNLVNLMIAGLVAFNFFEPLAGELESPLKGTFLEGFEDGLALFIPFAVVLGVMRVVINNLANAEVELPALLQQIGSGLVALMTGYLAAGFLIVVFQTLPWDQKFLGFEYTADANVTRVMPPDHVWLALMHRAGNATLAYSPPSTFDPEGTFELRYARLRRFKESS